MVIISTDYTNADHPAMRSPAGRLHIEWVLVNFSSSDGLDSFIHQKLDALSERFTYVRVEATLTWHLSIAKNLAHQKASGDVLMNLDCDNLIGDAPQVVQDTMSRGARLVHMWSGIRGDGTCGRIALTRNLFRRLGGYDESFFPMGYQDLDLIARAGAFGIPIYRIPCDPSYAIRNPKTDIVNVSDGSVSRWSDMNTLNIIKSINNIKAGRLTANPISPIHDVPCALFKGKVKQI